LVLLGVVLIALAIRVSLALRYPTLDDAYITFRYARNLARGLGFVYNPGEHVLGTTTPLFALVLAPFNFFGFDIILLSKLINSVASTINVILVFMITRRRLGEWAAVVSAMLLAITPSAVWGASTGMETEFNVTILFAAGYAFIAKRYALTAVLSALAVITRADDLLFFLVIIGWQSLKGLRVKREWGHAIKMASVFGLCLLPWVWFAMLYFGSPIPSSILSKAAASRVSIFDNAVLYVEQFGFGINTPRALVATFLFLLGLIYLGHAHDDFLIFPFYFGVYSAAFVLLGVRLGAGWYWQPLWPTYCIIFGAGIKWLIEIIQHFSPPRFLPQHGKLISVMLALLIALVWFGSLKARFIDNPLAADKAIPSLEAAGRWLERNAAADAKIGLEPIGAVGWFSDRYIVDFVALVSPAGREINERLGAVDFFGNLRAFQPDYYLAWEDQGVAIVTATPEQHEWFYRHYQQAARFGGGDTISFILFKKISR
jgi:hypothetical protein